MGDPLSSGVARAVPDSTGGHQVASIGTFLPMVAHPITETLMLDIRPVNPRDWDINRTCAPYWLSKLINIVSSILQVRLPGSHANAGDKGGVVT